MVFEFESEVAPENVYSPLSLLFYIWRMLCAVKIFQTFFLSGQVLFATPFSFLACIGWCLRAPTPGQGEPVIPCNTRPVNHPQEGEDAPRPTGVAVGDAEF